MKFGLNHLQSFMVVAQKGNLSSAAEKLGTTQPNVGRQIVALSNEIGVELFIRHSRGMALTKEGQKFFELSKDIISQLAQFTRNIREKDSGPQGNFHFLSGMGILEVILENITLFSERFPKVTFSFSPIINAYQLQIGEADAAVVPSFQSIKDPNFIQHPLYDTKMRIYASPSYLQVRSVPKILEDLRSHKIIVYAGETQEIELNKQIINEKTNSWIHPYMKVGTALAMRTALINGAGIGCYAYQRDLIEKGLLVDVFPDMPDQVVSYNCVYHSPLEGSPKIEAFYEFLKEEVIKSWKRRENSAAS